VDVADPRDACGCLPSISSRKASTAPKPLCPVPARGAGFYRYEPVRWPVRYRDAAKSREDGF
jgi:hypothetical protein